MGEFVLKCGEDEKYRFYCVTTDRFLTPSLTRGEMLLHLLLHNSYQAIDISDIYVDYSAPRSIDKSDDIEEYNDISHGEDYSSNDMVNYHRDWAEIFGKSIYELVREKLQKSLASGKIGLL